MASPPAGDAVLTAYARALIRHKARQLSRRPGFSRSDEEDVAQELTMAVLAKAHLFDPSRASASTFAARVIESAVAMILRDRNRRKRAAGFVARSIEETLDCDGACLRDLLEPEDARRRTGANDESDGRAEVVAGVVSAFQSLPAGLQDIASRLMETTENRVAHELGISRRQLRKAVERLRIHFANAGLGDP